MGETKIMKRLVLLNSCILLLAMGCSKPGSISYLNLPTTVQDTADWQVYMNEEFGYKMKYPQGWTANSDIFPNNIDF